METGSKKRSVKVIFKCNKKDPNCGPEVNKYCGMYCNRTIRKQYAANKDEFFEDPEKFLSEKCTSYVTDDRIIFEEICEDGQ